MKGVLNVVIDMNYSSLISIICTVITSLIAFLTYKATLGSRAKDSITDRVKRDTAISTKLDMVLSGNNDLKDEVRGINDKFDIMTERIARCEEQTKNVTERVEILEEKINKEW